MMNYEEIKSATEKAVPGTVLKVIRESLLLEDPKNLLKIAEFLKTSDYRMDYVSNITAVDYLQYLESVYHLYSMEKKTGPITLRVRVPRDNPKIASLVPIYRGAEYQEREAYDTYGIVYENHPDLRRIFMWEGFEGFPMRKDYLQEDSETLEMADIEWLEKNGVQIPPDMRQKAEELKKQGKRAVAEKPGQPEPA